MVTLLHWKNCLHFLTGSYSISWARRGLKCEHRLFSKRQPGLDPSVPLTRPHPVALMHVVKKAAGAGPWMGGQPTARYCTPQLDSGVVRAQGTHAHKSHQHRKKSFQEGVGTRVPSRPFYTRPAEPVSLCQWKPQEVLGHSAAHQHLTSLPRVCGASREWPPSRCFLGTPRGTTSLKATEPAGCSTGCHSCPLVHSPF